MSYIDEMFMQLAANEQEMYGDTLNQRRSNSSPNVITNVPEQAKELAPNKTITLIESTKPVEKAPPEVAKPPVDPYEIAYQSIKDQSARIEASKDFGERNRLIMDMRQSAVSLLEDAQRKTTEEAERTFNLASMRDKYQFALKKVQHFPELQPQLAVFEKQLQNAEMKADAMAKNLLKANPKLQTFIKTIDGEIAIHTKMTDALWQRQQRNLDKEELQKEAAADRLAGVVPAVRETLITKFPGLSDDVAMAKFIDKDGHGKDWIPILQGTITPDSYLTEALRGNKPAKMMAILEQQKRTGMSEEVVVSDMRDAERFTQDPNFMFSEMAKYGLAKPEELKNMAGKLKLEDSKSTREGLMKFAIGNVDTYLRKKNEARIDSNLTAWPQLPGKVSLLSLPEAAATYKRLESTLGQAPNLPTFAKAFLKDAPDNEGRLQRQAMLTDAYTSVLSAYGNGVFHVPFSPGMIADKNRKLAVATAWEAARSPQQIGADVRSGKFFTDVMNSAYEGISSLQGIGGVGGGQGAETLDAFFKGLTGGK